MSDIGISRIGVYGTFTYRDWGLKGTYFRLDSFEYSPRLVLLFAFVRSNFWPSVSGDIAPIRLAGPRLVKTLPARIASRVEERERVSVYGDGSRYCLVYEVVSILQRA